MKSFILIFSLISFITTSCTETPVIVSDVCKITQEICYYSDMICKNFNHTDSKKIINENVIKELNDLKNETMMINDELQNKSLRKSSNQITDYQYRLSQIRNDLKKIYDNEIKK